MSESVDFHKIVDAVTRTRVAIVALGPEYDRVALADKATLDYLLLPANRERMLDLIKANMCINCADATPTRLCLCMADSIADD